MKPSRAQVREAIRECKRAYRAISRKNKQPTRYQLMRAVTASEHANAVAWRLLTWRGKDK